MYDFMLWHVGHRAWRFGRELSGSICHGTMWSTSQTKWPFISRNSAPAKAHRPNGSAHMRPWAAMICVRLWPVMQRGPDHVMRPFTHLRHPFSCWVLMCLTHVRASSLTGGARTLGVLRRGTGSSAPGFLRGPGGLGTGVGFAGPLGRPRGLRGSAGGKEGDACRGR